MKLQVKENSEASLLDPTFPNVMEEIQSKIFARLPPHLTIVTVILKVMKTLMFQVTDLTVRFS